MTHTFQSGELFGYVPKGCPLPDENDVIVIAAYHIDMWPKMRRLLVDVCGLKLGDLIKLEHFQQLLDGGHIAIAGTGKRGNEPVVFITIP